MALYLGSEKVSINFMGVKCALNILSGEPFTNNALLVSSDGYILTDCNGVYITTKESE